MACMCGDICCWSCGPAQGNYKCFCGKWASDCEDHFDEDGTFKPEFQAEADAAAAAEREADDAYAREMAELEARADEIAALLRTP